MDYYRALYLGRGMVARGQGYYFNPIILFDNICFYHFPCHSLFLKNDT